jgi:hypothetical protein
MVDVAAHLAVQPSVKLCTTRQNLRAPRTSRQHAPTAADSTSQMSKSWNKHTQSVLERDEPASSRRKANTPAHQMT